MTTKNTNMARLVAIMAKLRDPDGGCPWDVEQTFASIAPHTIEEAYEVAGAIDQGDMAALEDELGDLLLQVVFHARMAEEDGFFDFEDVAGAICDKLVRRHPHVFGDTRVDGAAAQTRAWEAHKARERSDSGEASALDGITAALPALSRALKLQKRAARVGFDWTDAAPVLDKFEEEIAELGRELSAGAGRGRLEDETGDLLFTCVNLARKLDLDPEQALRKGNAKFERRFRRIEALLAAEGRRCEDAALDELEALWERAKGED
ncbi:MAG: nucleoside triphosphate pyrophosphohydrolase [Proteobacteria bacterium]|nr:nucleoside triphosphate pyrophosphohydrolase [Pseudomonadota bacterium]